jgi:hypothetical protein
VRIWLLSGGVPGDIAGRPNSRLAMLPGTTHVVPHKDAPEYMNALTLAKLSPTLSAAHRPVQAGRATPTRVP